jgi:hypothetical protein
MNKMRRSEFMGNYVLKAIENIGSGFSDGYYTGESYIYQGEKFAVVDRNTENAKIYTSKARAENACKMMFENYSFEVVEEPK